MAEEINSDLGISRRQLIKRGAIVGGTVMWAAPMIQSLTTPAGAQTLGTTQHACCCCRDRNATPPRPPTAFDCSTDGDFDERSSAGACKTFCAGGGKSHTGTYHTFQYQRTATDPGCTNNTSGVCSCTPPLTANVTGPT